MSKTQIQNTFVDVPGGSLFVRQWTPGGVPAGSPIVLLHDSLGCVDLWRDFPEALANSLGRPVIAYGKGGALETVLPQINGLCFGRDTIEALCETVLEFERIEPYFCAAEIRKTALRFDESLFSDQILEFVSEKFLEHRRQCAGQNFSTPAKEYQASLAN